MTLIAALALAWEVFHGLPWLTIGVWACAFELASFARAIENYARNKP